MNLIIWEPLFNLLQMTRSFAGSWSSLHTGPQGGKGLEQLKPVRLKCERTQKRELGEKGRAGSQKEEKGKERQRQRGNETPVMQRRPTAQESLRRQPAQNFRSAWRWYVMR